MNVASVKFVTSSEPIILRARSRTRPFKTIFGLVSVESSPAGPEYPNVNINAIKTTLNVCIVCYFEEPLYTVFF